MEVAPWLPLAALYLCMPAAAIFAASSDGRRRDETNSNCAAALLLLPADCRPRHMWTTSRIPRLRCFITTASMLFHPRPRLSVPTLLLLAAVAGPSSAFVPHPPSAPSRTKTAPVRVRVVLASAADANDAAADGAAPPAAASDETTAEPKKKNKATLGFITFDLDDTLYPVGPVFTEANQA